MNLVGTHGSHRCGLLTFPKRWALAQVLSSFANRRAALNNGRTSSLAGLGSAVGSFPNLDRRTFHSYFAATPAVLAVVLPLFA